MARTVKIYTDGACSKNPGPAGYAAVVINWLGKVVIEHQGSVRAGTNNIAELMGIQKGLAFLMREELLDKYDLECDYVAVFTDSQYCIGVLTGAYRVRKNVELIEQIRAEILALPVPVRFVKVRGHAGNEYNERADELAKKAVPPNDPDETWPGSSTVMYGYKDEP